MGSEAAVAPLRWVGVSGWLCTSISVGCCKPCRRSGRLSLSPASLQVKTAATQHREHPITRHTPPSPSPGSACTTTGACGRRDACCASTWRPCWRCSCPASRAQMLRMCRQTAPSATPTGCRRRTRRRRRRGTKVRGCRARIGWIVGVINEWEVYKLAHGRSRSCFRAGLGECLHACPPCPHSSQATPPRSTATTRPAASPSTAAAWWSGSTRVSGLRGGEARREGGTAWLWAGPNKVAAGAHASTLPTTAHLRAAPHAHCSPRLRALRPQTPAHGSRSTLCLAPAPIAPAPSPSRWCEANIGTDRTYLECSVGSHYTAATPASCFLLAVSPSVTGVLPHSMHLLPYGSKALRRGGR